jgi:hypothetical protein
MKIEGMFEISIFAKKCIYYTRSRCLAPKQLFSKCRGCVHFNFRAFLFSVYFKIIGFAKKVAMQASRSMPSASSAKK